MDTSLMSCKGSDCPEWDNGTCIVLHRLGTLRGEERVSHRECGLV